jgi:hypothetical protein
LPDHGQLFGWHLGEPGLLLPEPADLGVSVDALGQNLGNHLSAVFLGRVSTLAIGQLAAQQQRGGDRQDRPQMIVSRGGRLARRSACGDPRADDRGNRTFRAESGIHERTQRAMRFRT